MAKPEWGVKRVCQSCAAKFYDLKRSPITCPKCAAPFDPEALLKSRRSRPSPAKTAKAAPVAVKKETKDPAADDSPDDDASGESATVSDDDSDDASVLQDASELGDDGVSGVAIASNDSET